MRKSASLGSRTSRDAVPRSSIPTATDFDENEEKRNSTLPAPAPAPAPAFARLRYIVHPIPAHYPPDFRSVDTREGGESGEVKERDSDRLIGDEPVHRCAPAGLSSRGLGCVGREKDMGKTPLSLHTRPRRSSSTSTSASASTPATLLFLRPCISLPRFRRERRGLD